MEKYKLLSSNLSLLVSTVDVFGGGNLASRKVLNIHESVSRLPLP